MSEQQQIKFCVLLIATKKYKQFVSHIVNRLDKYMLPKHEIAIMVFSDEKIFPQTSARVQYVWTKINSMGWPYATLYRYEIFAKFSSYLQKFTHLLYMDVDMDIVADVNEEIVVDGLLGVKHPAFASGGWGSPNNPETSTSWFPAELRKQYYCGGVQGGRSDFYLGASQVLAARIQDDKKNNVMAEWHDETHWNKWLNVDQHPYVTTLGPEYCSVPEHKRAAYGISEYQPKIIALDKNHKEIRS